MKTLRFPTGCPLAALLATTAESHPAGQPALVLRDDGACPNGGCWVALLPSLMVALILET